MKWIDYREKLGIGFSDKIKAQLLANKVAAFICNGKLNEKYSDNDYYQFCLMTGISYASQYPSTDGLRKLFTINDLSIRDIVSYYVAFVNTQTEVGDKHRRVLLSVLLSFLDDLGLQSELICDDDGYYVFPKGAKELDDALVSEPLEWLKDYPKTHKAFCIALKQYSDGEYIRDTADNLRKALESFLQEFLGNAKNLETNKVEICRYLGARDVDAGISGLFQPVINAYKNINDRIAKHNDKVDEKLLEFLLYQTGILMRMVLVVNQSIAEKDEIAD